MNRCPFCHEQMPPAEPGGPPTTCPNPDCGPTYTVGLSKPEDGPKPE